MMPLLNGFQASREILKAAPATKVLMLSAHSDEEYVEAATNCGSMGYLLKHTCADSVCQAIREIQNGNTFFRSWILSHLRKRNRKK
jgi:DNA-binding NarL/FixJ family response regulator